jgi:hypothetical protein
MRSRDLWAARSGCFNFSFRVMFFFFFLVSLFLLNFDFFKRDVKFFSPKKKENATSAIIMRKKGEEKGKYKKMTINL